MTSKVVTYAERESSYDETIIINNVENAYLDKENFAFRLCFEGTATRVMSDDSSESEYTLTEYLDSLFPPSAQGRATTNINSSKCAGEGHQQRAGYTPLTHYDLQIIDLDIHSSTLQYRYRIGTEPPIGPIEIAAPIIDTTPKDGDVWENGEILAVRRDAVILDLYRRTQAETMLVECIEEDCEGPINDDPEQLPNRQVALVVRSKVDATPIVVTHYDMRHHVERPWMELLKMLVVITLPLDLIATPIEAYYAVHHMNLSGIR